MMTISRQPRTNVSPRYAVFRTCAAFLLFSVGLFAVPAHAQGSEPPPDEGGCKREKTAYVCDWAAFRHVLLQMHSVTVDTLPLDRFTAAELRNMVGRMGKNVAAQEQPADLTITLRPVEPNGVDFGPAEHPLATLQVYRGNSATGSRKLLWVETYSGQGDRPWPSTVHALIAQFEERLGKR